MAGTALLLVTLNASADCITIGTSTVCDAAPPTPWTSTLGTGSSATASGSVRLLAGAVVDVGNADAVVMGEGDDLVDLSGAIIGNVAQGGGNDTAILRAGGSISGTLAQGAGNDRLELRGGTLTRPRRAAVTMWR